MIDAFNHRPLLNTGHLLFFYKARVSVRRSSFQTKEPDKKYGNFVVQGNTPGTFETDKMFNF